MKESAVRAKLFISVSIVFLMLFIIISCEKDDGSILQSNIENNTATLSKVMNSKKFDYNRISLFREKYDMHDVKNIAKYLAVTLKDKELKRILKKAKNGMKSREKILEASTFMNFRFNNSKNGNESFTFLEKMTKHMPINVRASIKNKLENLEFGAFDIYFPFKKDRENWTENDELLLAVVNSCNANGSEPILAYNQVGEEVYLNPKQEHDIAVLVVCPSEKYGNYENKTKFNNIYSNTTSLKKAPNVNYYVELETVMVEEQFDGGFCGYEMELRVDYRMRTIGGNWSGWSNIGVYDAEPSVSVSDINKTFISVLNSYNYEFAINVWEVDDWLCGDDDPVVVTPWDYLYELDDSFDFVLIDEHVSSIPYSMNDYHRMQENTEWSGHCVIVEVDYEYNQIPFGL